MFGGLLDLTKSNCVGLYFKFIFGGLSGLPKAIITAQGVHGFELDYLKRNFKDIRRLSYSHVCLIFQIVQFWNGGSNPGGFHFSPTVVCAAASIRQSRPATGTPDGRTSPDVETDEGWLHVVGPGALSCVESESRANLNPIIARRIVQICNGQSERRQWRIRHHQ